MKHRMRLGKLGRDSKHRWAMLRTMADQLIAHERIQTTEAKAKELRRVVDHIVTLGKRGTDHASNQARAILRTEASHDKVFSELAARYANRPGGFTRIQKIGWRRGDSANMVVMEFVDRDDELRPAKPVNQDTVLRNKVEGVPRFRDLLPSRDWVNDPFVHHFQKK
mmetsp:Transcript_10578/g.29886  ORF Transcript_10578/g.29886 Transcript_10578/m.29886 type:complete len:166 (-) Transcript_10578:684-1181(-)